MLYVSEYCYIYSSQVLLYMCLHTAIYVTYADAGDVANSGAAIYVSAYCYVYSSQVLLYMCLHSADVGEVANSRLQVSQHSTHRLARCADGMLTYAEQVATARTRGYKPRSSMHQLKRWRKKRMQIMRCFCDARETKGK